VTITARSSLATVAATVGRALARARIRAVLTGGACATIYSDGAYTSHDLDFVLQSRVTQSALDDALATAGFNRVGDRYEHPRSPFWLEFPPGPLGIGGDADVRPVRIRLGATTLLALSPTDSCRDRLAAFYHWNDRQSLAAAIAIARRRRVNLNLVKAWSDREGATKLHGDFRRALALARARRSS
jgi:hypothetical protein